MKLKRSGETCPFVGTIDACQLQDVEQLLQKRKLFQGLETNDVRWHKHHNRKFSLNQDVEFTTAVKSCCS